MRLVPIAILMWSLLPDPADAGAWTLPEGDTQVIFTTERKAWPVEGLIGEPAPIRVNASQIFVEHGLTADTTLGAALRSELDEVTQEFKLHLGGHVRHRVWTGAAGDVASVQAGLLVPLEEPLLDMVSPAGSVIEASVSALYGRGWQWGLGDSFVSSELGYLYRGGDEADEIRAFLTVGHAPIRPLLALLDIAGSVPLGDGETSLKIGPSVAWTLYPWLGENDLKPTDLSHPSTIQLGVRADVLDLEAGLTVYLGIWQRF